MPVHGPGPGSGEQPVDRGSIYSETFGDRACAQALGLQGCNRLWLDCWRPTLVNASSLSGLDSFHLPLATKARLEFSEDAQHVEKRLPGRARSIDRLLGRLELHALGPQPPHDVLKVAYRSSEPVNSRDGQRIARPKKGEDGL